MLRFVATLGVLVFLLLATVTARRRLPNEVGLDLENIGRHLLGENVDVPKANSPDDHLVTDLPLLDPSKFTTDHWAGLLPASADGDKYFFYWLFAPPPTDTAEEDIPLIIWLNGGPACSSMDGLWVENGPFRLKNNDGAWEIDIDANSWHNTPAYVVYIDQPVGTGISFTTSGKYPTNDNEVNTDFYYFLKEFMLLHADKFLDKTKTTMSRNLFFSGESHAGHYIPSMMNYIRKQNENSPAFEIPLAGAAIGNGWVDPTVQYSAHEAGYGYSLIGRAQKRALEERERTCQQDLEKGNYVSRTCFSLLNAVVDNSQGAGSEYSVSEYDYRFWENKAKDRDFPPGHKDVEAYLGGKGKISSDVHQVLAAIHSTPSYEAGQRYMECTDPPYNALKHQDGLGVTGDVVELLNSGVKLLFFNGVNDLICNHVGNEIAIENFAWEHQDHYQEAKRYGWKSPSRGQLGGYMKEYKNLMYLKVLDSGHMVPMDVPDVALDLMRGLVFDIPFETYEQKLTAAAISQDSQCPVCPSCTANTAEDTLSKEEAKRVWMAMFFTGCIVTSALCLLCCCIDRCFCRKKETHIPIQKYDLELSDTNYSDGPGEMS